MTEQQKMRKLCGLLDIAIMMAQDLNLQMNEWSDALDEHFLKLISERQVEINKWKVIKDLKIGDIVRCKVANYQEGDYKIINHNGEQFVGRRIYKNGKLGQFDCFVQNWIL